MLVAVEALSEAGGDLRREGRARPAGDGGGKRPRGTRWGKGDGGRSRGLYIGDKRGCRRKRTEMWSIKGRGPWITLPCSYTITKSGSNCTINECAKSCGGDVDWSAGLSSPRRSGVVCAKT